MKTFLFFSIGILASIITNAQCVVTNLLDDGSSGSLRQTINNCAAGGTVTFASGIAGDTIFLQEQSWQYSSLDIQKEIIIDGTDSDITIVGSTYSFFDNAPQPDNVFLIGFTGSTSDPSGTIIKGLTLIGGQNSISINDNGTGLVENITVENCNIKNTKNNGIVISKVNNIKIINNSIEENEMSGIQMNSSDNSKIYGNIIESNGYDGIQIFQSKDINVENNTIRSNGENDDATSFGEGRGLYTSQSELLTVFNNTIAHNFKNGILLDQIYNSLFSSNLLNSNGLSSDIYLNTGFMIASNSNQNTFKSNTIQNHLNNGFEVHNSSNNYFEANNVEYNGNIGLFIQGNSSENEVYQNSIKENSAFGILINNDFDDVDKVIVTENSISCNGQKGFYNLKLDSTIIDTHWIDQSNTLHAETRIPFALIEIFNNEKELNCDTCQSSEYIGSVTTDENGDFSFSITGTFDNVTFSVSDPIEGILTFSTCVKIRDEVTGSIESSKSKLSIYPNPTENKTLLPYSTIYSVYDAKGSLVLNGNGEEVDLTKQPSGIYLIKTSKKTYSVVKK